MSYLLHYVHILFEFKVVQSSLRYHVDSFSCPSKAAQVILATETAAVLTGSPPFCQQAPSPVMEDFFVKYLNFGSFSQRCWESLEHRLSIRPETPKASARNFSMLGYFTPPCLIPAFPSLYPSIIYPTLSKVQPPPRSSILQTLSTYVLGSVLEIQAGKHHSPCSFPPCHPHIALSNFTLTPLPPSHFSHIALNLMSRGKWTCHHSAECTFCLLADTS